MKIGDLVELVGLEDECKGHEKLLCLIGKIIYIKADEGIAFVTFKRRGDFIINIVNLSVINYDVEDYDEELEDKPLYKFTVEVIDRCEGHRVEPIVLYSNSKETAFDELEFLIPQRIFTDWILEEDV